MKTNKRKMSAGRKRRIFRLAFTYVLSVGLVLLFLTAGGISGNTDEPSMEDYWAAAAAKAEQMEEEKPDPLKAPDPSRPMVALTFDDGPRAAVTDRILQSLRDVGGRATFFMVGQNVAANEDSVNQMVAQGSQVGNHTFHHRYISQLGAEDLQTEIGGTNQAVLEACGILPNVMRPPGGKTDERSLNALAVMGMPAVMWSIDTRDWQTRDAQQTIQAVLDQVKDGDVILMHDIYPETADAAEVIIPALVERGFQLVTVGELAACRGGMVPGRRYSRFYP